MDCMQFLCEIAFLKHFIVAILLSKASEAQVLFVSLRRESWKENTCIQLVEVVASQKVSQPDDPTMHSMS